MTDLERALAILDEMIVAAECRCQNDDYGTPYWLNMTYKVEALREARSRLAALATTTPDTIPREGEA